MNLKRQSYRTPKNEENDILMKFQYARIAKIQELKGRKKTQVLDQIDVKLTNHRPVLGNRSLNTANQWSVLVTAQRLPDGNSL